MPSSLHDSLFEMRSVVLRYPRRGRGVAFLCVATRRGGRRSVGPRESWFKGEQPCSQTGDLGATRRQRAFFSFPPPQQQPASGRGVAQSEDYLNAVHKGARLRHRNLDRELRTTVLMSALSFSFEYGALARCRKSVPFGTVTSLPQRELMGSGGTVSPLGHLQMWWNVYAYETSPMAPIYPPPSPALSWLSGVASEQSTQRGASRASVH